MNLHEKIDYEYKCFFLSQMMTSKENIYAHSGEIECKKNLKDELHRIVDTVDDVVKEVLLVQENLLESAFRFLQDGKKEKLFEKENLQERVDIWLAFLME